MRVINILLSILISLLLGLAVLEVGLRLIGKGPQHSILEFDSKLGWKKSANAKLSRKWPESAVTLRTNQYGLNDDPTDTTTKPAGEFRVVALGDSFTQGFTVDRKDLFVDLLESWWQAEGRKVDLVNAGCEAYSTDQEVVWLLENGEAWKPDAVLLFAYENDLAWNGEARYINRDTPKPLFRPDGSLESGVLADPGPKPWTDSLALTLVISGLRSNPAMQKYFFQPEGGTRPLLKEWGAVLVQPPDFMANALARTEGALIALKKKCAELGSKLIVVPIPSHSDVDPKFADEFSMKVLGMPRDAWSPDKPVDTFLALAKQAGIETIDPRAYLRERAARGESLYFKNDWHLDPAGNRALAEFLHAELDRVGLFPAEQHAKATVAMPVPDTDVGGVPFAAKLFGILWVALSGLYMFTYKDEKKWLVPLKIGALLASVFTIALGGNWLLAKLEPRYAQVVVILAVLAILGFVIYKLGRRVGTILELCKSFTLRGHWYLMPLIVVLLSIGSLLVVAASSPFVAPFIYTLF
jgi:lysophospholipase L1-like esterase